VSAASRAAGARALGAFELVHGASWLTPEGEVHVVPGFHEEWLREHEDLVGGARNVCELVLSKRWISVALFEGGYLELMVPDRRSEDVRKALGELLSRNASAWNRALVMSMDEEGYSMLESADAADEASLEAALGRSL
jgi:hypothetical protein